MDLTLRNLRACPRWDTVDGFSILAAHSDPWWIFDIPIFRSHPERILIFYKSSSGNSIVWSRLRTSILKAGWGAKKCTCRLVSFFVALYFFLWKVSVSHHWVATADLEADFRAKGPLWFIWLKGLGRGAVPLPWWFLNRTTKCCVASWWVWEFSQGHWNSEHCYFLAGDQIHDFLI